MANLRDAAPYVAHVFANLWPRGVEELAGLGLTPEQGAAKALEYCGLGENYAYVIDDGEPVCVFGAVDGVTWFQATPRFDEFHKEITEALRSMGAKGGYTIYSQCIHPRTEAWFKRCGYIRDDWEGKTVTGKPLYRFRKE